VTGPDPRSDPWSAGLDDPRRRSLTILAALQLGLAWILFVPYTVEPAYDGLRWVIPCLVAASLGALAIVRRGYRAAAIWMVLALLAAAAMATRTAGPAAGWSFSLVVGAAGVLLGPGWSVVAAAASTAALLDLAGQADPAARAFAWSGLALAWASVLQSWLAVGPLREALAWATGGYEEARARTEEAERHRGELGLAVKRLQETHERLERLTSELVRARRAAEEAYALKARFAAYVSHELRTPLNLIVGFSEMMVLAPHTYGGEVLPLSYRGDLDAIYRSAKHLAALIDDVLDLSQIDAHRLALDRDDAVLADVVAEALATVRAAYDEDGLWLRSDVAPDLPTVYLDRTRVRQVLINLLANARRHTRSGGATVRAAVVDGEVVVSVADTGRGIAPDLLPRLFQEFEQGDDGAEGGGSGLGLAIARRFVTMHGGWIRAESQPGVGSTFSFALPLRRAVDVTAGSALWSWLGPDPTSADALPIVAVAGDDPWLVRTLRRYLDGYRIVAPPRVPPDAAAVIHPAPTDAAGWAALERTCASLDGRPTVVCSLRGAREAMERLDVADHLDKPITRERLVRALAHHRRGRTTRTVLVVDDDPHMVRLLARMIQAESRHFRVVRAYGGREALDLMRQSPPDLVLLDLLMPEVDGYEVLRRMRDEPVLRDVPVAVVSARGLEEDAVLAGMFGLARAGGFPAAELMRCLKATLDSLSPAARPPPAPDSAAPARPAARSG
jgi:signal transduction histidine kinase/CheY-like chemotaxis protein